MPKAKGGLGRGLDALIGPTPAAHVETTQQADAQEQAMGETALNESSGVAGVSSEQRMLEVPIDRISPNPRQPRQQMNEQALDELADSIREHGLLQPLLVTRNDEGSYNLIAGERRWRAAMLAGMGVVPAVLKEATSRQMLELALVENLQRADLNPLEASAAYKSLVDEFGLTQEEVAARVGKSRQAVANSLRLQRLSAEAQESLALGMITEGHARALLQVPDEAQQLSLLHHIVADGLSVRQAEALARRLAERAQHEDEPAEEKPAEDTELYDEVRALEDRFRNALGTKVQLSRSRRGGRLVIYFYSDEELDRIYGAIVGEEE